MSVAVLQMEGVRKRFGANEVLGGLSLSVSRGEVYGLLGPNGCGKSTAIHIACGLLDADAGLVRVAGAPGLCPQEVALYRDLLPAENLDFYARVHGLRGARRRARVAELMRLFQLEPQAATRVAQLSGGWQQRLNLAVALVQQPQLLILDEPTSAVDVEARHALWSLIDRLRAGGMTILLTTHQLAEAERLCTRVGLMRGGRIAAEGTIAELLARVPAQAVALLQTSDAAAVLERAAALGWATRSYAGQLACLLPHPASLREVVEAFEGVAISSVSVQSVTLEHAYLEVMQQPG